MADVGPVSSLTARTAATLANTDSLYIDDGASGDFRLTWGTLKSALAAAVLSAGILTASAPLTVAQTWNAGGVTFTAFKLDVTDTVSTSASLLVDFQVGGASKFSITKVGSVLAGDGTISSPSFGNSAGGFYAVGGGLRFETAGVLRILLNSSLFQTLVPIDIGGNGDCMLGRGGASTLQIGPADANSPIAQTIKPQGARVGTDSNLGGADFTINPSIGTGTGTPAKLVINGIVGFTTGTGAQTVAAVLTSVGVANGQLPSAVIGSAALATNATDGFLYIPTCAGAPTGVPTAFAGRIPMIYDTTNHQFWFYDGGWKQPKTPAGAAIVTWQ